MLFPSSLLQGPYPSTPFCTLVTQSCLTLCDPLEYSLPGSSVLGILQARILEWVAISLSQGISPTQGSDSGVLHGGWILYHLNHQGSPNKPQGT